MMTRKDYIKFAGMFASRLTTIKATGPVERQKGSIHELTRVIEGANCIFAEDNPAFNADRFDAFITKAATSA